MHRSAGPSGLARWCHTGVVRDRAGGKAWYDSEQANFVAIAQMAVDYRFPGVAWKFAVVLWPYLTIRRPWHVWRDTHLIGMETARAEHDEHGEGWIATQWAEALRQQGQIEESQRLYDHILALRERSGDQFGLVNGLVGAARLAVQRGRLDRARTLAHEAERTFAEQGQLEGQVRALHVTASIHVAEGQPELGCDVLNQALELVGDVDRPSVRRPLFSALADIYIAREDFDGALDALDQAAKEHAVVDDRWAEADLRRRAGDLRHQLDRLEEAQHDWTRARDLYAQLGDEESVTTLENRIQQHN
jgi:tetratricopeptide (TPR) repeat protein